MTTQDKLAEMFQMQEELNKRIGVADFSAMDEKEQAQWILNYCRAMSQELAELTDSVPWKWWAKYQTFDKQNARVEVIDLFHFLISLAQILGMSADDVHRLYTQKNKVNHQRQESGYSVKDESDNKQIGQG
ncbi:MAG TPA: dUTPase [Kiritimatiellia bacterium]|nr:dUTPase [Kiritimatiellia bacterium]HMP34191.1 dUTPase [Kiritimatiellia bacterium]